jgi:hypothetical protein
MHTAIENILNSQMDCRPLDPTPENRKRKMRTKQGRATHKILFAGGSIGFGMKLYLAVTHRLVNSKTKERAAAFLSVYQVWLPRQGLVRWVRSKPIYREIKQQMMRRPTSSSTNAVDAGSDLDMAFLRSMPQCSERTPTTDSRRTQ